jgi:sialidase-1
MTKLVVAASGVLFINPDPSRYHVFASHAHPLQLSATEFVSTYQRGSAIYAADVNIAITRSHDGGQTWANEGYLREPGQDGRAYSYHDGFLSRLRDGTLVVLAFRVDRSDPDRPLFGPTGGMVAAELVLFLSRDAGRHWSPPRVIALPGGPIVTPANPILELADGRWLATFDQWHGVAEPGPYKPRMLACFSADQGRTWGEVRVLADGVDAGRGYWHGKTIRLANGQLFSTFWTADLTDRARGPRDRSLHYSYGDPAGRSWSAPAPKTTSAQTHRPAELPGGRMAAIYTWRIAVRPGFMAVLSEDGGRTWDLDNQVRLWDATGWTHLGINAPEVYPHSHDTVAFGAPTLLATLEGDLYASWWCTYASITHIRWARLRTTD